MAIHIPNFQDFFKLPEKISKRLDQALGPLNSAGFDPWGLDPETLKKTAAIAIWFYQHYFRVETTGLEKLPSGKIMVVANHSGQLPFDAMMLASALLLEATPARIPRGMMDYWVPSLPFISNLLSRSGAVVGSPQNCLDMLRNNQCVMVFPEGTRGLGKPYSQRYQLQKFGNGFMRLAIEAKAPIVPVSIIGAEEAYPGAINIKPLAKLLRAPYFPVTPLMALAGPMGVLPLPVKLIIKFGDPMVFEGDPDMTENEIQTQVEKVKNVISEGIDIGLEERGNDFFGVFQEKKTQKRPKLVKEPRP